MDLPDVSAQEWARRVRRLDPADRAKRLAAVNELLAKPEDLCAALESELYALRHQLQAPGQPPPPVR